MLLIIPYWKPCAAAYAFTCSEGNDLGTEISKQVAEQLLAVRACVRACLHMLALTIDRSIDPRAATREKSNTEGLGTCYERRRATCTVLKCASSVRASAVKVGASLIVSYSRLCCRPSMTRALVVAVSMLEILLSKSQIFPDTQHCHVSTLAGLTSDQHCQLLRCFHCGPAHPGAGRTRCQSSAQRGGRALQQSASCITSTTTVNYTTLGLASDPWCLQVGKATADGSNE